MVRPTPVCWAALLAALVLVGNGTAQEKKPVKKPKVEVVFCLDTTGSMGGLIEGAKQKIWAISNQIASGKPTPELKIGLVAFRDRGDVYITKVIDLTDDLDAIHGQLKGFQAQGGGDTPESVNQALDDAVNKISWSSDKSTLRILFLVGDAPPHMDYPDDVKYPVTCRKACEKGILINTVQCGRDAECTRYWKDICRLAEGSFVQIPQEGGVVTIATPYDRRLAEINGHLATSVLVYGDAAMKAGGEMKATAARSLAAPAAADRAGLVAKDGRAAVYDLLDAVKGNKVKLETLKKEELPKELQKLSLNEQKDYLEKLDKRRAELRKEALDLDKKRGDFIQKKLEENSKAGKGGKDSFDNQVLEVLRKQAKKHDIGY